MPVTANNNDLTYAYMDAYPSGASSFLSVMGRTAYALSCIRRSPLGRFLPNRPSFGPSPGGAPFCRRNEISSRSFDLRARFQPFHYRIFATALLARLSALTRRSNASRTSSRSGGRTPNDSPIVKLVAMMLLAPPCSTSFRANIAIRPPAASQMCRYVWPRTCKGDCH
jgi:hypothetical protein